MPTTTHRGRPSCWRVAQACSRLEPPKRPVLFSLWDGEEQGLIGSGEYAKTHQRTEDLPALAVVCDMIGRASCDRVYVYGVDTVVGLQPIVDEAIGTLPPENPLVPTYIHKHLPRSDHWPFYKRNVPYLLFHTGVHDDYHRPTDDADTLNYQTAESISRLAFDVIMTITRDDFVIALHEPSKDLPRTNLPPKSTATRRKHRPAMLQRNLISEAVLK